MSARVLHVVTLISADGRYGGPQTVARTLAGRFGHEIWGSATAADFALDPTGRPGERRFRGVALAGGRPSTIFVPSLWWALWRTLGRRAANRPDVVHLHTGPELPGLGALLVLVLRRAVFVVQPHGMFSYRAAVSGAAVSPKITFVRRLIVPLLRKAQVVVALTDVERRELIAHGLDPALVQVIPNGLNAPGSVVRAESAGERPVVAFVGRLHPRKHPERFTAAAAKLAERNVPARFVMAGNDQGALDSARRNDPRGVVEHLGALTHDEALRVMAEAAVTVMCSDVEPFGMVAIEALDAGAALLVTDSCDIAEELASAGCAVVTDVTPDRMADGIEKLLRDGTLRTNLAQAGHRMVAARYSMDVIAPQWEALYGAAAAAAG